MMRVRFARWKHTDTDAPATPKRFPKYLAKQTCRGIGKTAAFDPKQLRCRGDLQAFVALTRCWGFVLSFPC